MRDERDNCALGAINAEVYFLFSFFRRQILRVFICLRQERALQRGGGGVFSL